MIAFVGAPVFIALVRGSGSSGAVTPAGAALGHGLAARSSLGAVTLVVARAPCSRWPSSPSARASSPSRRARSSARCSAGGDPAASFIVRDLRLPRVLCAVLVGRRAGHLGRDLPVADAQPARLAGHRRLQTGAAVGALIVITMLGGSGAVVSRRRAGRRAVDGARGLRARLQARRRLRLPAGPGRDRGQRARAGRSTDYLLSRARIEDAQEATRWLLGSLNGARLGRRLAAARALRPARARARRAGRAAAGARAGRRRRARARRARGARAARARRCSPSRSSRSSPWRRRADRASSR